MTFVGTDPKPAPIEISYTATNTLLVRDTSFTGQSRVGTISLNQIPTFATTGEVPERVAKLLEYNGPPAALAARVDVEIDPLAYTVKFTTSGIDPNEIVKLADAFANTTVTYLSERQQEDRLTRLTKVNELVDKKKSELDAKERVIPSDESKADPSLLAQRNAALTAYQTALNEQIRLNDAEDVDINLLPQQSAQPVQISGGGFSLPRTRKERVPLGAGLGALLGCGVALVVERLDARIRDRKRAEEAFNSSVLVEFPVLARRQRGRKVLVGPQHHTPIAENFRSLRTSVMFMTTGGEQAGPHQQFGVIMVTSPSPAEGKTTTALNLAAAFAETGRRVILVNADFRRPAIVKAVIAAGRPPLPGGLMALTRLPPSDFLVETDVPGVELLDLAPLAASAGDLTRATVKMASQLRHEADVVIVDTPPLSVTTEALEFVPISEVVILIGRIGSTTAEGARRAAELVEFAGAKRVGIALTAAGTSRAHGGKYYDYYSEPSSRRGRKHDTPAQVIDTNRPAIPATSAAPTATGQAAVGSSNGHSVPAPESLPTLTPAIDDLADVSDDELWNSGRSTSDEPTVGTPGSPADPLLRREPTDPVRELDDVLAQWDVDPTRDT